MPSQSDLTSFQPKKPYNYEVMTCMAKNKDFMHPHPELEKLCETPGKDHHFKGWGEVYIVCEYCRMKCGMCMD